MYAKPLALENERSVVRNQNRCNNVCYGDYLLVESVRSDITAFPIAKLLLSNPPKALAQIALVNVELNPNHSIETKVPLSPIEIELVSLIRRLFVCLFDLSD